MTARLTEDEIAEPRPTKAQRRILRIMHIGTIIKFWPGGNQGAAICVPGEPDHFIRLGTFRVLLRNKWIEETRTGSGQYSRSDSGVAALERWRK